MSGRCDQTGTRDSGLGVRHPLSWVSVTTRTTVHGHHPRRGHLTGHDSGCLDACESIAVSRPFLRQQGRPLAFLGSGLGEDLRVSSGQALKQAAVGGSAFAGAGLGRARFPALDRERLDADPRRHLFLRQSCGASQRAPDRHRQQRCVIIQQRVDTRHGVVTGSSHSLHLRPYDPRKIPTEWSPVRLWCPIGVVRGGSFGGAP